MVMELSVCPSLTSSQNHGLRSLGQVAIFSLGIGTMWSRISGPCQQTVMEGTPWDPGLQEAKGVMLVELCNEKEDSQLSEVAPVGDQWWGHANSMWDLTGLYPLSTAAWALPCGKGSLL